MQNFVLTGRVLLCSLPCHTVVQSSHSPQSVRDLFTFVCQLYIFGEDTGKQDAVLWSWQKVPKITISMFNLLL